MESTTGAEGSILIAHISDVHLRNMQYAAQSRGDDFFAAFKRAVNAACASAADVIVCTGDNFDVARPSAKTIGQMIQIDRMLVAAGKRMLTITGNHDFSNPTWLNTLFPCSPETAASGVVPMDSAKANVKGFIVGGIAPYTAAVFRNKTDDITKFVEDCDVVLYHGFIDGITSAFAGGKNVLHVSELPSSARTKAYLLGDIHIQQYIDRTNAGGSSMLVGYPGSLEMCSSSESVDKSIPLIRVTPTGAAVESTIPLTIRPFIHRKVRNPEDLDALIAAVTEVADQHPVVPVEFDRSLPQTVSRLHAVLDAQRAVIRCYPLPAEKVDHVRTTQSEDAEELTIQHFISRKFSEEPELESVALALFDRGDSDASNIISDFIEKRLAAVAVRE